MMLNRVSAHLQTLGNHIYARKSSWTNIYLLKVKIETLNSKNIRTTFYCIYCSLWGYFIPFFSVSAVEFEQVNVCWVPVYQFTNAEITYCYITSRCTKILVKKQLIRKGCDPKQLRLVEGKVFFRVSVTLFHKSNCGHPFLTGQGYFKRALAAMNCIYIMYLKGI